MLEEEAIKKVVQAAVVIDLAVTLLEEAKDTLPVPAASILSLKRVSREIKRIKK